MHAGSCRPISSMSSTLNKVLATGSRKVGFVGLSFEPGPTICGNRRLVTLAEQLIAGNPTAGLDPEVHLSRLLGANRRFIEQHVPILAADAGRGCRGRDGVRCSCRQVGHGRIFAALRQHVTDRHTVLDRRWAFRIASRSKEVNGVFAGEARCRSSGQSRLLACDPGCCSRAGSLGHRPGRPYEQRRPVRLRNALLYDGVVPVAALSFGYRLHPRWIIFRRRPVLPEPLRFADTVEACSHCCSGPRRRRCRPPAGQIVRRGQSWPAWKRPTGALSRTVPVGCGDFADVFCRPGHRGGHSQSSLEFSFDGYGGPAMFSNRSGMTARRSLADHRPSCNNYVFVDAASRRTLSALEFRAATPAASAGRKRGPSARCCRRNWQCDRGCVACRKRPDDLLPLTAGVPEQ